MNTANLKVVMLALFLPVPATIPAAGPAGAAVVKSTAEVDLPGLRAPALPQPAPKMVPSLFSTNGIASAPGIAARSTLKREIRLTENGAEATWGRSKVSFPSDLSSPISVVTPDGHNLAFRPTFPRAGEQAHRQDRLAWLDLQRNFGATVENIAPDFFYYPGAIRGIEQNLIVHQALPSLPAGWSAADLRSLGDRPFRHRDS